MDSGFGVAMRKWKGVSGVSRVLRYGLSNS